MNGDEAVIDLLVHEVVARDDEFGTDRHREDSTNREEAHRRNDVLDTHNLVVGRVFPVAGLAHVLTGVVHVVLVAVVTSEEPAERSIEGADADPEADHPARGRHDRYLVGEVVAVGPEELARDEPKHPGEDDAGDDRRTEVLVARDPAAARLG